MYTSQFVCMINNKMFVRDGLERLLVFGFLGVKLNCHALHCTITLYIAQYEPELSQLEGSIGGGHGETQCTCCTYITLYTVHSTLYTINWAQ